jgi:hypothetical protein
MLLFLNDRDGEVNPPRTTRPRTTCWKLTAVFLTVSATRNQAQTTEQRYGTRTSSTAVSWLVRSIRTRTRSRILWKVILYGSQSVLT